MVSQRIVIISILCFVAHVTSAQTDRMVIYEGNQAFKNGEFEEAQKAYEGVSTKSGLNDVAQFNKAAAQYRGGDFEAASSTYDGIAQNSSDRKLKSDAHFNKGNALTNLNKLEEAADAYKDALRANPQSEKARNNLKYVLNQLQQQEQQEQDEQSEQDPNQENQDGESDENNPDDGEGQEDQGQEKNEGDQNSDGSSDTSSDEGEPQEDDKGEPGDDSGQDEDDDISEQGDKDKDEGQEGQGGEQESDDKDPEDGDKQDANGEGSGEPDQGQSGNSSDEKSTSTNTRENLNTVPNAMMGKEEAARILNAIENNEKEIQGKMRGKMLNGKVKQGKQDKSGKDW